MEQAASNAHDVEEAPSPNESLDEDIGTKFVVLPIPKVSTSIKGVASNHIEQMTLLE